MTGKSQELFDNSDKFLLYFQNKNILKREASLLLLI